MIHLSIYQSLSKTSKFEWKMISFLECTDSELSLIEGEVLIQAIEREPVLLKFIADKYKTQKIYGKATEAKGWTFRYVPDCITRKKCLKKSFKKTHDLCYMSLIIKAPQKCVKEPLKKIHIC